MTTNCRRRYTQNSLARSRRVRWAATNRLGPTPMLVAGPAQPRTSTLKSAAVILVRILRWLIRVIDSPSLSDRTHTSGRRRCLLQKQKAARSTETPKRPPVYQVGPRAGSDRFPATLRASSVGRGQSSRSPQHRPLFRRQPSKSGAEPAFLEARQHIEQERGFSAADAVRQAHRRPQPIDSHSFHSAPSSSAGQYTH